MSKYLQPEELTLLLIRLRRHQAKLASIRNYTIAQLLQHLPTNSAYQVSCWLDCLCCIWQSVTLQVLHWCHAWVFVLAHYSVCSSSWIIHAFICSGMCWRLEAYLTYRVLLHMNNCFLDLILLQFCFVNVALLKKSAWKTNLLICSLAEKK